MRFRECLDFLWYALPPIKETAKRLFYAAALFLVHRRVHAGPVARCSHAGRTSMNLLTTLSGSMMEGFLPAGWDLARIDELASQPMSELGRREPWWHRDFEPV